MEERRIRWTTFQNLKMWFRNWRRELGELGMTKVGGKETVIPKHLWGDFLNLDETCISLGGSQDGRGGRPVIVFYDPMFPVRTKATSKSALTSTIICGCLASGEALPPHFQFPTKAEAKEREQIRDNALSRSRASGSLSRWTAARGG